MNNPTMTYYQDQLIFWAPKVLIALLILIATWFVARAVKWVLEKAVDRIPALRRQTGAKPGETVGSQLGTIAKLIVWLVGIMAALQFLGIGQILRPIDRLTNEIFLFLPRLIGAGVIFFVGLVVARIMRDLVETIINAANVEGLLGRVGITAEATTGKGKAKAAAAAPSAARASIARAAGILAFAFIIIPVAIAALQVLGIEAISDPAVNMLNQIMAAIPRILSAALWLGIAFLAAGLLRSVIEGVLPPTGFDNAVRSTGMLPATSNPTRIVGTIVFVAVLLGAGIEAARQLGGDVVAEFLAEITALGGRVLFGTLIIAVGVLLARVVATLVGTADAGFGQSIIRYAVIALFAAIGLRYMGLANEIVILAFGLILGSAALALGLAFGLGGRRPAEKILDRYADRTAPTPAPRARSPKPPAI